MENLNVIDMHCDTILNIVDTDKDLLNNDGQLDLQRMKNVGYRLQCFAMYVNLKKYNDPYKRCLDMIKRYNEEINKNNNIIKQVKCYQDLENNINNNIMSSMLTIEEGGVLQGSIEKLQEFYNLGVRMITLTWNYENEIGYPNYVDENKKIINNNLGLKPKGIEIIKEMERLHIIIDVSHLSDKGFYDVYENTTKPFVASHSNCREICNVSRNLTDDMIIKLASRKGVMGLNYCTSFVKENEKYSYVKDLIKHINHVKKLVGIDYIGLGSDFDGIGDNLELKSCDLLPLLYEEMIKNNFTKEEIEKVFYKNVMRVFKEVLK